MIRRLMAGLLVCGFLVASAGPVSGQKDKDKDKDKGKSVTLAWKLEPKKTFYQKMVTTTTQSMTIMGNTVNQTQNQTFYFAWTPTKVDQGKATIEQEIIGVSMDIEIGGSKISYDSTKDTTANNPLGDFFKALVGSKFTVELDMKDLKVTNVEGRDDFIKKLVAANPQMKALLEQILSKDALREMAEPTFAVIPTGPAKKGDKWKRTTKLAMGPIGTYTNTYNYTYEGGDKDMHRIKMETTLDYKEPGDAVGAAGLPFKIKSASLKSSNPTGQITFDQAKGRLDKSSTALDLKGKLSIEIGGQTTTVELTQNQKSEIQTMDENPIKKK